MKFHGLGGNDGPSGVLVYHNTFVSPANALVDYTTAACHHFAIENNLFVGPTQVTNKVVEWDAPTDDGLFDFNGYFPDGKFTWNKFGVGYQNYASFSAAQMGGWETNGRILTMPIFANAITLGADYKTLVMPADVTLAGASNAIDKGTTFANVDDGFKGAAPDLGAFEIGCPIPIYGPRPDNVDETNEPTGCVSPINPGGDGGMGGDAGFPDDGGPFGDAGNGEVPGGGRGCGCHSSPSEGASGAAGLFVAFALLRKRRR
jgi:MYXO-CTERM domain-containing protein